MIARVWLELDSTDVPGSGRTSFVIAEHDEVQRWLDTSPDDAIAEIRERVLNVLGAASMILDIANGNEEPNVG